MADRRARFGPYVYTAELGTLRVAADCSFTRWASVHEVTGTSHLVYHLHASARDKFTVRRFLRAAEAASGATMPLGLAISSYALHPSGTACLVTPFPGDLGGVTTLRQHLQRKGGRLAPHEVARAAEHLIDALVRGEAAGRLHGSFDLDGCIVGRGGRVAIELFGFAPLWSRTANASTALRGEHRRSLAKCVREMLAGQAGDRDMLPSWTEWLAELESDSGNSLDNARASMPRTNAAAPTAAGVIVRSLWTRVKQLAARG